MILYISIVKCILSENKQTNKRNGDSEIYAYYRLDSYQIIQSSKEKKKKKDQMGPLKS